MKKIFNLIFVFLLIFLQRNIVFANVIDKTIFQSGVNKSSVSVCVKDVNSGKTIYKLNENQPKMPASTLKLVTYAASTDALGIDYVFSTELYKASSNNFYLKLSGDPLLSSSDLNKMFKRVKEKNILEPKHIYIDDFIFDDVEWGEGWQWDDDLNPLMPKFSSYNLDGNLITIVVYPTTKGSPAEIKTSKFYPVTFMNLVTTGSSNFVKISRNNSISPDIINVSGTVEKQIDKRIPVNNPKRYFKLRLEDAISGAKIGYYGKFLQKKTPQDALLIDKIVHTLADTSSVILKSSNNLAAESVFKAAGAKYANNTGSLERSLNMLNDYFKKYDINPENVRIVDGSGVSKNNLVTALFMCDFLVKSYNDDFVKSLPTAGEGTLKTRMLYFKNNLYAKTGTLSDVSAIAGYITSRTGKTYAFDIMINDPKSSAQEKKSLEEYILRDIFASF